MGRSASHGFRPFYGIALGAFTPSGSGSTNRFLSVTIVSGPNSSTSGNSFIPRILFNCCVSFNRTVSIGIGTQSAAPTNCSIISNGG